MTLLSAYLTIQSLLRPLGEGGRGGLPLLSGSGVEVGLSGSPWPVFLFFFLFCPEVPKKNRPLTLVGNL